MRCSMTVVLLTLIACGVAEPNQGADSKIIHTWLTPASPGGKGGNGGLVSLSSTALVPAGVNVEAISLVTEGHGGLGGKATIGSPGPNAPSGEPGKFALNLHSYAFDATGISAEMVTDVNGSNFMIYLKDNADPLPVMELDTLHVANGSHLELGCDVRIRARRVHIEEGGSLVVRGRDSGTCTVGVGLQLSTKAGLHGGQVFIDADTLELDGTLDIAGNSGAPGQAGGNGGSLEIRATRFTLGSDAQVLANGGNGGEGLNERELP